MSDVVLHPAFQAEELDRQRQQLLSISDGAVFEPRLSRVARVHARCVRRFALRLAERRHAGHGEKIEARRSREISRRELRAESSDCSRSRETSRRRKPSPSPKNILATGRRLICRRHARRARANFRPAYLADRQARRGANADSRRQTRHSARRSGLHSAGGDEPDFWRRLQQPAEYRSAHQEGTHVRRVLFLHAAPLRRLVHRRNFHAHRSNGGSHEARGGSAGENVQRRDITQRNWISRATIWRACIPSSRKPRSRWPIACSPSPRSICPRITTARIRSEIRAVSLSECKGDRAAIFHDQGSRYRARRKRQRVSRCAEKGISGRAVHGDSIRSDSTPLARIFASEAQASAAVDARIARAGKGNPAGGRKSCRWRRACVREEPCNERERQHAQLRAMNAAQSHLARCLIPDRSHGQVEFQGQTIMQVCDGKSAWLQFPDKVVDASQILGEFKRGITMFGGGWGLYQRVLDGKLSRAIYRRRGNRRQENAKASSLKLRSAP